MLILRVVANFRSRLRVADHELGRILASFCAIVAAIRRYLSTHANPAGANTEDCI